MTLDELANFLGRTPQLITKALEEVAKRIGEDAKKKVQEKFGTYQDGWPELSPATIADKIAQGWPVPSPLLRTGEMKDSIDFKVDVKPWDVIVTLFSDSEIIGFHELGTSKMPPRPAMAHIFDENKELYSRWVNEALANACVPGSKTFNFVGD